MSEQSNTIEQKLLKLIVDACITNSNSNSNSNSLEYLLDLATSEILNSLYEGFTPLMYACRYNPLAVKCLLDCDKCTIENVNKITLNDNLTALMIACEFQPDAVKYLLESDKCTTKNLYQINLIDETALIIACKFQPDAVKYLLESEKCSIGNVEYDTYGITPLMYACKFQPKAVEYLVNSDKCTIENIECISCLGCTALMRACGYQPDAVKYLLDSGKCDSLISTIDLNNAIYLEKSIEYIKNYKNTKLTIECVENENENENENNCDMVSKINSDIHNKRIEVVQCELEILQKQISIKETELYNLKNSLS
jgi:ankyrin repeat protein